MKYLALILTVLLFQEPQVITLKDYYCGKGVIFDSKSNFPFREESYKMAITPDVDNVKKAEDILFEKYYDHRLKVSKSFDSDKNLISTKYKISKNVKKRFKKFYRQYASYIDKSNDTIVYIGLFDFSNKAKAEQYFDGWNKVVFLGSGEYYYKHQEHYEINISKKIIAK